MNVVSLCLMFVHGRWWLYATDKVRNKVQREEEKDGLQGIWVRNVW